MPTFETKILSGLPVTVEYIWDPGDLSVGVPPGPEIIDILGPKGNSIFKWAWPKTNIKILIEEAISAYAEDQMSARSYRKELSRETLD